MLELQMNEESVLVDTEGNPVKLGDDEITIKNAQTHEQVKAVVQKRLARQSEHLKTLEAQAEKTPEMEKMIGDLRLDVEKAESAQADAEEAAAKRVAEQVTTANKDRDTALQALEIERVARIRDQVSTKIIGAAKDIFINPAEDIVPRLLAAHKREPLLDDSGKPVDGQFLDLFELTYEDEKGASVTGALPVDKALDVMRGQEKYQHYIRATATGGKGGSKYTAGARTITKMSQLKTRDEKIAFVGKHGQEAFMKLTAD